MDARRRELIGLIVKECNGPQPDHDATIDRLIEAYECEELARLRERVKRLKGQGRGRRT